MRLFVSSRPTLAAILPYAVWMVLMFALPATAEMYALRTALTAIFLGAFWWLSRRWSLDNTAWGQAVLPKILWGVLGGALVCVLWILPEQWAVYRDFSLLGFLGLGGSGAPTGEPSPYEPAVCGWTLTWIKLIGSAFIIAPVEEIFFRSFLYRWLQKSDWTNVDLRRFDWSAFLWMVGLFALEHHTRLLAGAMAGACYGYLAIRRGLGAAILAHIVTNLLLGLYVIYTGKWGFW